MAVLAELPALPLHTAGKYVAGAYVVLFALVLVYVAIMAVRMSRLERELGELLSATEQDEGGGAAAQPERALQAQSGSGRQEGTPA
jgi:CcmD family protein